MKYLLIYLLIINIIGFIVYALDKAQAKKNQNRISEKFLFLLAILGGSLGAVLAMSLLRHKTQHWYFKIGIPLILIAQILLLGILFGTGILEF